MSWIIFTISATILQTFRNLEQKNLNKKLDALTVSWSRFILPLPFAIAGVIYSFSFANSNFIFLCAITGCFQIAGNFFLLRTISAKNFGVGIAFYKTEVLQSLLLGILFFNQSVSSIDFIAIITASVGMILMSNFTLKGGVKNFHKQLDKAALFGTLSGLCFSFSAFSLKFATQSLTAYGHSSFMAAVLVLMWVICFQNVVFALIKAAQNRLVKDLKSLFIAENKMAFVKTGILSFLGSICWFVAYALGNVIYVKAVGQMELLIAVLVSHLHLKEGQKKIELIGIVLTLLGILTLILFH